MSETSMETRVSRVEERLRNLNDKVESLAKLDLTVAVLGEQIRMMREDFAEFASDAKADRQERSDREAQRTRDRTEVRKWAIGLLVVILVGVIGCAATLLAAGAHS